MNANLALEKKLNVGAWIISGAVLTLVVLMRQVKLPGFESVDFSFLPPFHATLNALTAVVLIGALIAIKNKNVVLHQRLIYVALSMSVLFLLSYVAYHFTTPDTLYGDVNHDGLLSASELEAVSGSRGWYLLLLLSHIFSSSYISTIYIIYLY